MKPRTLMVMAGGTGGHVYPAMAVADDLISQGWRVVWLCTEGGMENRLIADKPYEKAMITMRGVRGKGLLTWLVLPFKLSRALAQSIAAMRLWQPDVVLGMGGFAAFPGGIAAKLLGKALIIHEQNSIAGLTNRLLAKLARQRLCAFPNSLPKGLLVGNPVRAEICQLAEPAQRFAQHSGPLRILVVGGSLGAQALNDFVPAAIALMPAEQRPSVLHQAGTQHIQALQQAYQQHAVAADCRDYLADMAHCYDWADFVICRAGAMTVAELAAVGLGSVLVPFPFAVDDHQTSNARYLAEHGAACLMPQSQLNAAGLAHYLSQLSRAQCLTMAQAARALGKPQATQTVAQICQTLAQPSSGVSV